MLMRRLLKNFFNKLNKSLIKRKKEVFRFLYRGKNIAVLSDSHGAVFEYAYDNNLLFPHVLNAEIVAGATAYGLKKENSVSYKKYENFILKNKKYSIVVLQLGEVDCGFLIWHRAKKYNTLPTEQIVHSLDGYKKLLDFLLLQKKKIIMAGVILPTIKDHQTVPKGLAPRDMVSATQKERSDLVLAFNEHLKMLAKEYGCLYVDITNETIDSKSGLLMDDYIEPSKVDCHQKCEKTAHIWARKLKELL